MKFTIKSEVTLNIILIIVFGQACSQACSCRGGSTSCSELRKRPDNRALDGAHASS